MPLTFSVPDTELSLTLQNRRSEVIDNIFRGTPFMNAMSTMGGVITTDGGESIIVPLRMSKNSTAGSFTGYDLLDNSPQSNETSARFEWSDGYATVSIAWDEEMKNQGRGRLINILNQKTDDAMDSVRDKLNVFLLQTQPSAGSKDTASISEIIDDDPTADPPRTAAIGSIGNANTWWRNKQLTGGPFTVADMNTSYNDVSDGSDFPTFAITSQTVFEYYEASQVGLIRYQDTRVADAGFQSLQFKQIPIVWDPQIGLTNALYLINTKYLKLEIMAGADFVAGDFIEPDNQAAKVAKILYMAQLTCSNRRRQGIISAITAPA